MAEVSGTTREAEDVGLAGQIDALLAGISDAAAGLAADQASDQIESTLTARGQADRATSSGAGAGAASDEGDGAPTSDAAAPESGAAEGSEVGPAGVGTSPAKATQGPLRPDEVESLSSQIDSLVRDVGAAISPEGEAADATGDAPTAAEAAGQDAVETGVDGHAPGAALETAASQTQEDESPAQTDRSAKGEDDAASGGEVEVGTPLSGAADAEVEACPEPRAEAGGIDERAPVGANGLAEASGGDDASASGDEQGEAQIDLGDLDKQLAEIAMESDPAPAMGASDAVAGTVLPGGAGLGRGATATSAPAAKVERAGPQAAPPPAAASPTPESSKTGLGVVVRALARAGGTRALVWIRAMAEASARAVDAAPKAVKDTIGWVGLVTVFFACCMWAVVLFFRSPKAPEAYGAASDVLEPGEPTPQPRPRPHAASAEEHGKEEGGGDTHGGGGGGGGHGESAPSSGHDSGGSSGGGGGGHGGH